MDLLDAHGIELQVSEITGLKTIELLIYGILFKCLFKQ
jgi:hypothetical protein